MKTWHLFMNGIEVPLPSDLEDTAVRPMRIRVEFARGVNFIGDNWLWFFIAGVAFLVLVFGPIVDRIYDVK